MVGGITHVQSKDGRNFVGRKKKKGGGGTRWGWAISMLPLELDPRIPDQHLVWPKVLLTNLTCSILV
jgi:hypothetical protein